MNAATRAAEGVVLAMPMSPVSRQSWPASTSRRATSAPARMPCTASSRLIAGPVARSDVPAPELVVEQVRPGRQVGRDAHVDDVHLRAGLPGQHVDRGAAGAEVRDHRRR